MSTTAKTEEPPEEEKFESYIIDVYETDINNDRSGDPVKVTGRVEVHEDEAVCLELLSVKTSSGDDITRFIKEIGGLDLVEDQIEDAASTEFCP